MAGMGNLTLGALQGVNMADNFYRKRNAEELARSRDQRDQDRFDMQKDAYDLEREILRRETAGQKLYALSLDGQGNPRQFTPDDNQYINKQIVPVLNEGGIFNDFMTSNPDVDPINPIGRVDLREVYDPGSKEKRTVVMIGARMRDGSIKPTTMNRTSNPDDDLWTPTVEEFTRYAQIEADPRGVAERLTARRSRETKMEDYGKKKGIETDEKLRYAKGMAGMGYTPTGKRIDDDITDSQKANNAEIDAARKAIRGLSREEILTRTQEATATGRDNPDYDPYLAGLVKKATQRKTGTDSEFEQIHRQFYGTQQPTQEAPPAAIEYLRQNPQLKDQFQRKYGYLPEGL